MGSKLRYLVAPVWLLNMIFLFGSLFEIFSKKNGQLAPIPLGVIGLFFVFFIYLFYDVTTFKRIVFVKIIGYILIVSSIYYIFVKNILFIIPTLVTGILVLRHK